MVVINKKVFLNILQKSIKKNIRVLEISLNYKLF